MARTRRKIHRVIAALVDLTEVGRYLYAGDSLRDRTFRRSQTGAYVSNISMIALKCLDDGVCNDLTGRRFLYTTNPCGNFSGTSSLKFRGTKGSIGHTFMVCIHTENQNQGDFCPFALLEISVLHESPLGHLRYGLTDVPPQPNSPPDNVFNPDQPAKDLNARSWALTPSSALLNK